MCVGILLACMSVGGCLENGIGNIVDCNSLDSQTVPDKNTDDQLDQTKTAPLGTLETCWRCIAIKQTQPTRT